MTAPRATCCPCGLSLKLWLPRDLVAEGAHQTTWGVDLCPHHRDSAHLAHQPEPIQEVPKHPLDTQPFPGKAGWGQRDRKYSVHHHSHLRAFALVTWAWPQVTPLSISS